MHHLIELLHVVTLHAISNGDFVYFREPFDLAQQRAPYEITETLLTQVSLGKASPLRRAMSWSPATQTIKEM
jgi:hypothetical protein